MKDNHSLDSDDDDDDEEEERERLVQNALDIVQTRTCRVEQPLLLQPTITPSSSALRLLAPVFDSINHEATPNACFELLPGCSSSGDNDDGNGDGSRLVVRALEDLEINQEITIDYGQSARPDWKCLNSYGFVPAKQTQDDDDDEAEDGAVAEVYRDGIRYEVGPTSIPEAMVTAARDALLFEQGGASSAKGDGVAATKDIDGDDGVELTPEIAVRLARRLSDAAYHLLLDPPARATAVDAEPCDVDVEEDECEDDDDNYTYEEEYEDELPDTILSKQLAAQLGFSSHRILLKCSLGLHDWAVRQQIHP